MGGKETIKQLRLLNPEVKAIVSSGYSEDPIMANFAAYGFSGGIAKPFKAAEFIEVLDQVLNRPEG